MANVVKATDVFKYVIILNVVSDKNQGGKEVFERRYAFEYGLKPFEIRKSNAGYFFRF